MTHLRSALYMAWLVVTVIPYALCCVLWAPLPLSWRYRLTLGWPRMALWGARWILGMRYQAQGWEHLPTSGPAIILSAGTVYLASILFGTRGALRNRIVPHRHRTA